MKRKSIADARLDQNFKINRTRRHVTNDNTRCTTTTSIKNVTILKEPKIEEDDWTSNIPGLWKEEIDDSLLQSNDTDTSVKKKQSSDFFDNSESLPLKVPKTEEIDPDFDFSFSSQSSDVLNLKEPKLEPTSSNLTSLSTDPELYGDTKTGLAAFIDLKKSASIEEYKLLENCSQDIALDPREVKQEDTLNSESSECGWLNNSQITNNSLTWNQSNNISTYWPFKEEEEDDEFGLDEDDGLVLGSSVLFQHKHSPDFETMRYEKSNYKLMGDTNGLGQRKPLTANAVRQAVINFFAKNKHPTAKEMLKLGEELIVRYKTIFGMLDKMRKNERIKCPEGDPCNRIKGFFLRDGELLHNMKIPEETKQILEDNLETHILSRKRFSLGYVHVIMEKTDLPPAYIRSQYECWKKKLLTKDRDDYRIGDWKRDTEQQSTLSIEVLRKLESAYLEKKYQCKHKSWSPKEISELAGELNLTEKVVSHWIEKRQSANLGLDDDVIQLRREKDRKRMLVNRKLPQWKVDELVKSFSANSRMSLAERMNLGKRLNLSDRQVTNYLNKKRIIARKNSSIEEAQQEIQLLSINKKIQLEKAASKANLSAPQCEKIAKQLGISLTTFTTFRNWNKRNKKS